MYIIKENILKTGLCRYGEKEYHVYICKSDVCYGTGDCEDVITGEDTEKECFSVWYEDILHPGKIMPVEGILKLLTQLLKRWKKVRALSAGNKENTMGFFDKLKKKKNT